jgi:hypothetical protein
MATREVFVANQILTAAEQNALATAMIAINAQTGTTYTTVLTDDGKLITCSNASAISVTIPPNSSVAYGIGTQLNFAQLSTGQVTLACAWPPPTPIGVPPGTNLLVPTPPLSNPCPAGPVQPQTPGHHWAESLLNRQLRKDGQAQV